MTDRKRALQEAWRALAGWHVGMSARRGAGWVETVVDVDLEDDEFPVELSASGWSNRWRDFLPDLDAPANWGAWEAYVREHSDGFVLIRRAPAWTRVSVAGREHKSTCYASALLGAYVRWVPEGAIPPEVLAWWELEKKVRKGVLKCKS